MQATRVLRHGLVSLCLMCSLSGCGTLRGLLSPPPAPPAAQVCPSLPSALVAPVAVPDVCLHITDGESLLDCTEALLPALQACNSQLNQIKSRIKE